MRKLTLLTLLVTALLAGCGGSSGELAGDDVAKVGDCTITKERLDGLLGQARRSYKAQGRPFPKAGSAEFVTLRNQALDLLVTQCEYRQEAEELDVSVSEKEVDDRLAQIKKQYFQGSEKRYRAQLKAQGLTDEQVHSDIESQLLSEKIFKRVTEDVKVTDAEIHSYYVQHPQLYSQPQSRDIRHILVKQKPLADRIYGQLKGGADFAKLAKQHSQDPGSKEQGGKLTVSKGQTVPEFDKTAFALKTNELSRPVKTQYGWHVIQALSNVKPRKTTPEKQVRESIRQQLLQQKRNELMTKWVNDTKKEYASKIEYQVGYAPATTATTTGDTNDE